MGVGAIAWAPNSSVRALSGSSVPVGVELTRLSSNCREVLVLLVEGDERSLTTVATSARERALARPADE